MKTQKFHNQFARSSEIIEDSKTEPEVDVRELLDPDPDLIDFIDEKTQENELAHGLG
jgi:hypothetical protein